MIAPDAALSTITPRQREVLAWLARYVERYGYGPTYREVQAALGYRSPNAVRVHVLALQRRGLVVSEGRLCRSLRLAPGVTIPEENS